jgi:hypothetical protein
MEEGGRGWMEGKEGWCRKREERWGGEEGRRRRRGRVMEGEMEWRCAEPASMLLRLSATAYSLSSVWGWLEVVWLVVALIGGGRERMDGREGRRGWCRKREVGRRRRRRRVMEGEKEWRLGEVKEEKWREGGYDGEVKRRRRSEVRRGGE